jgi:hypothetical protein
MPSLHPFKVKPKHHSDLVKLILYADKLYRRKFKKIDSTENIPLTNFYKALPSSHGPLVKIAFNIYFKQLCRGNSLTRKTSLWVRREVPRINGQMNALLQELSGKNTHVIHEIFTIATSKGENVVKITTETTLEFDTQEKKEEFITLLEALKDGEDVV